MISIKFVIIKEQISYNIQYNRINNTMEPEHLELPPQLLLKHAKKHPHSHSISSESFSVAGRDIVIYNVSLKSDPDNEFDVANYRRGLTFLQEIIDYKEGPLRVAKKGLRKFFDIHPEYLQVKTSHISSSKFHKYRKQIIFGNINKFNSEQYTIYSTEKANGENAQISWDSQGQFWIIGSKNKTLLLAHQKDMKYIQHKHEHVRTLAIADLWFKMLKEREQYIEKIKQKLQNYTLIGEFCDTIKSGHIIDYGKQPKLNFYALVQKQEQQFSCEAPIQLLEFLEDVGLKEYSVKFDITKVKTSEALVQEIKREVYRVSSAKLQEEGEGRVVYITGKIKSQTEESKEQCLSVFKLKTLEYRIYRKLRQKIRIYFEKIRKSYDKILNKFIEEVKELIKGFETPKPEQYYFDLGRKAFSLIDDQGKQVSKFVHNKFVAFLKVLQAGPISKQNFLVIVNDPGESQLNTFLNSGSENQNNNLKQKQNQTTNKKQDKVKKQLLVVVPLTIPSSGKSTVFKKIKEMDSDLEVHILSSDTVRFEVMTEKMKRQKSMSKKAAYEKSRKEANQRYYKYMGEIIKKIALEDSAQLEHVFLLDKNHPENALKTTISEIKNKCTPFANQLEYRIVGLFPKAGELLENKPKYMYPFSSHYILSCAKRVLSRQQHETLQGTQNQRVNICLSFANMFRNFSLSDYHIQKYFDFAMYIRMTNELSQENLEGIRNMEMEESLLKILLGSKPGSFDQHEGISDLIELLKNWKYEEEPIGACAEQALQVIEESFIKGWKMECEQMQEHQEMGVNEKMEEQK